MSDDVPKPMFEYVRIMQGWGPVEVQYVCNTYIYICTHPDTPYKSQILEGYDSNSPYKQLLFVTSRSSWWSSSASLRKLKSTDIVVDDGIFIMYIIIPHLPGEGC